jgi:plasmid stabilization system protein ParE
MSSWRFTEGANTDLREIGRHIAKEDPHAARAWVERLAARVILAAATPLAGRIVPELRRDDVREVIVRPYRILYRIADDAIVVLMFFHSHRLFPDAMDPDADE